MKTLLRIGAVPALVVVLAALAGCSSGGGASEIAPTLYAQLGRADGVAKLANQFGANIESATTLNALSDSVAIGDVKTGLTNDIIKASAMTPPKINAHERAARQGSRRQRRFDALSKCLTDAGLRRKD
jgi:hypothetical protein